MAKKQTAKKATVKTASKATPATRGGGTKTTAAKQGTARSSSKPTSKPASRPTSKAASTPTVKPASKKTAGRRQVASQIEPKTDGKPRLLSGDNPQIAKGYGDEPVQAYFAAIPGWKQGVARTVNQIVTKALPGVHKAVKWNSPLYGVEGNGWFLGIHCFAKYVKLAFFKGASLDPMPPGTSKQKDVRYLNIKEHDAIDEGQLAAWVRQASTMQGEKM